VITDPEVKNDIYDHILSELKSQKQMFAPKKFIDDYVPKKQQDRFRTFLADHKVGLNQFHVDISEIKRHLKKRSFETLTGVRVTVPPESTVVEVKADRIIIDDMVVNVGGVHSNG